VLLEFGFPARAFVSAQICAEGEICYCLLRDLAWSDVIPVAQLVWSGDFCLDWLSHESCKSCLLKCT
jgi:hypothetical protein